VSTAHFRVKLIRDDEVVFEHVAYSPNESEAEAVKQTLEAYGVGNFICCPGCRILIADDSEDLYPQHETISALRVDLYECDELPADIVHREKPINAIRRKWIPHTMGDQIWVLYDFETLADREAWEATLSPRMRGWLDRELIPHALPFGWHTLDINGFPVTAR
jgi:hypothetical protein